MHERHRPVTRPREHTRPWRATDRASCKGGQFCSGLGEPDRKSNLRLTHPSLAASFRSFLASEGQPGPEPQAAAVEYASKTMRHPGKGQTGIRGLRSGQEFTTTMEGHRFGQGGVENLQRLFRKSWNDKGLGHNYR
jgi:hypothetical protein